LKIFEVISVSMSEGLRKRAQRDVFDALNLWTRQSLRLGYEMWDDNLKRWDFGLVGKSVTSLVPLV
jgi:hypothetical protein